MNPKQIEEFFHLTPVQKHVLRQSEQAAPSAHLAQFSCQLDGPLDSSAFERAWQSVTNHQPGLRMAFVSGDLKEPVQYVNRNVGVALEKQDWRNLSDSEQTRRLQELVHADRQSNFMLKTPPLWHMTLIRLSEERHYFVWTYHELLFDEYSLPLLFNEALQAYDAILHAQKPPLQLPVSFRKYMDWVRKKDAVATELFWRTHLKGFEYSTPVTPTLPEMTTSVDVSKAGTLEALAAQQYFDPAVLVYGAWALLLSRLSGQYEAVFGIQVSGRSAQFHGADRLIGHVRNTVPLRVRMAPDEMVVDWLTELQKQCDEVQRYGHASLTQIQSWSQVVGPHALFDSVVVFDSAQEKIGINREVGDLRIQQDKLVSPNHFPLTIMVRDAWELTGDAHVVALRSLLEQFAIAPQRRLAEIVLPSEQLHPTILKPQAAVPPLPEIAVAAPYGRMPKLPSSWTQPEEEEQGWVNWLKDEPCAHELFEARAAQMPNNIAVTLLNQTMTYGELNVRANQVARYLRKLNVVPSIPVGLCFSPSIDGVIAMLGVLKAGGAYLPLEAMLPEEELRQVVTDSATSVVLTQSALEPKFRTIPLHCIVLCLDSDWAIIGEEAADNLACQISDEHPACFLVADETPGVITQARLAHAVSTLPEWFSFGPDNPWHLFNSILPPSPTPSIPEPEVNDLPSGPDWFGMTPAAMLAMEKQATHLPPPLPEPDFTADDAELPANLEQVEETEFELEVDVLPPPELSGPELSDELFSTEKVEVADTVEVADAVEVTDTVESAETSNSSPEEVIAERTVSPPALAPIQQWFLAQAPTYPQYWNVSLLAEISGHFEISTLEAALSAVVAHHEALRWRFTNDETGWQCHTLPDVAELPFEYVDFSDKWARSQRKAIEEATEQRQASLHLSDGPLWRAAYFDLGLDRAHRLLIIAHQLIADETSLRIFLDDWLTAYRQMRHIEPIALPPATAAYQEWWQSLEDLVTTEENQHWQQLRSESWPSLPIDHPNGANTYGSIDRVFVSLNSKETESLLHHVPTVAEADVNELVLTALTLALSQWANQKAVCIEVEQDARKASPLDVTHTIGWFSTKFPMGVEVSNPADVTASLQAVKACLRATPQHGVHYSSWYYQQVHTAATANLPSSHISFRYMDFTTNETTWQVAPESVGHEHHANNKRPVSIAVSATMNLNMLEFRWEYAREQFEQNNIGRLVNSFIGELRHLIQQYSQQSARSGD